MLIKGYPTYNVIFNAPYFMKYMLKKHQTIRFSVAVASHKNVSAGNSIKKVFNVEITMLIHAALRYSEEKLSTDIWPLAMDSAVWISNWIPDIQSGLSNIEI